MYPAKADQDVLLCGIGSRRYAEAIGVFLKHHAVVLKKSCLPEQARMWQAGNEGACDLNPLQIMCEPHGDAMRVADNGIMPNAAIESFLSGIHGYPQFVSGLGGDQRLFSPGINETEKLKGRAGDGVGQHHRNEGLIDDSVIGDARSIVKRHEQVGASNTAAEGTR